MRLFLNRRRSPDRTRHQPELVVRVQLSQRQRQAEEHRPQPIDRQLKPRDLVQKERVRLRLAARHQLPRVDRLRYK